MRIVVHVQHKYWGILKSCFRGLRQRVKEGYQGYHLPESFQEDAQLLSPAQCKHWYQHLRKGIQHCYSLRAGALGGNHGNTMTFITFPSLSKHS